MTDQNNIEKVSANLTIAEQLNALNERMKRTSEMLSRLDRLADRLIAVGKGEDHSERGGERCDDCDNRALFVLKDGGARSHLCAGCWDVNSRAMIEAINVKEAI